jgi:hypothetical protein
LHAYKDNGKVDLIYNSYAWFNRTLDNKLVYSYTLVVITNDGTKSENTYKKEPFKIADIQSFEYKETSYKGRVNTTSYSDQERINSPILIIHYITDGKPHQLEVGFQLKGDANVINELNQIIKRIHNRRKR